MEGRLEKDAGREGCGWSEEVVAVKLMEWRNMECEQGTE